MQFYSFFLTSLIEKGYKALATKLDQKKKAKKQVINSVDTKENLDAPLTIAIFQFFFTSLIWKVFEA